MLLLLVAVLGVAVLARFTKMPYAVGLVLVGLIIGAIPGHPHVQLTPDLVMVIFLPALLFAGAWSYPTASLRHNWLPIVLLATLGVLISIAISWFVLTRFAGFASQPALLFGAMVAATDPIAVLSIFRSMHASPQLAAIVEGESLFNDATAVVAFKVTLLISIAATHVSAAVPVVDFIVLLVGGIGVGLAVGMAGLLVLRPLEDYLIEVLGTIIIAYGSYVLAERLHASGLIAVIVAGMVTSRVGARLGTFSATRQSVNQLWGFIAFVANSMLFLLVGLAINVSEIGATLIFAAWGIVAIIVARIVTVYGLSWLSARLGQKLPVAWQHIFVLGGLRGALSMALALSLPSSVADRNLLISMVFSVVLFTMIGQGLAIAPALFHLKVGGMHHDEAAAASNE